MCISTTQGQSEILFHVQDCAAVVLFCAEKSTKTALDAIQILGGNGYINDYPTGRYMYCSKLNYFVNHHFDEKSSLGRSGRQKNLHIKN